MIDDFLTQFKEQFNENFFLSAYSIIWRVIIAFAVIIIAIQLIKIVKKLLRRMFSKLNVDKSVAGFLVSFVSISLYVVVLFFVAQSFGVDAASIVALLGSAGVTIGLAIQGSLSNIAGGVLLLILKPFKLGDYIIEDTNMNEGTVIDIGLIYTKLLTVDNKTVILPNGTLANASIVNVTDTPFRLVELKFDIAYDSDVTLAKTLIYDAIINDACTCTEKNIEIVMESLENSSVRLCARFFVHNKDFRLTKCRVLEAVKIAFDMNGIEIPFNQIVVHKA